MKSKALGTLFLKQKYKKKIRTLSAVFLFLVLITLPQLLEFNGLHNQDQRKKTYQQETIGNPIIPEGSQLGSNQVFASFNNTQSAITAISKNGTIIYTGISINVSGVFQYNISAYSETGIMIWSYQSVGNYSSTVQKMVLNSDDSLLYILGDYYNSTENFDEWNVFLAVLYTNNGTKLIEKTIGAGNGMNDFGVTLVLSPSNNSLYIVSTYQRVIITEFAYETIDMIMLSKLSLNDFSIVFTKLYSDTYSITPIAAILTSDERFLYIGGNRMVDPRNGRIFLHKINANGELVSLSQYSPNRNLSLSDITFNEAEDKIYGIGTMISSFANVTLFTFDMNGEVIQEFSFGQLDRGDYGRQILRNPSNNTFYISGFRILYGPQDQMGVSSFIGEIDEFLNILWINYTIESGIGYYQTYYHLTVDLSNRFFVSSEYLMTPNFGENFTISKLEVLYRPIRPQLNINITNPIREPSILLFWNNISNANNYSIYGSEYPFETTNQANLVIENIQGLNYSLLLNETTYRYYRLTAKNDFGESLPSNLIETIYLSQDAPYLQNPFNYMTQYNYSINGTTYYTINQSLRLQWDSTGADYYLILRNGSMIENTTNTAFFESANYEGIWNYSVVAQTAGVNSTPSNHYLIRFLIPPQSVSLNIKSEQPIIQNITLNWTQSPNANYYRVYVSGAPFYINDSLKFMVPVSNTTENEINITVSFESTFYFIVVAVSDNGSSQISNIVSSFVYMPILTPDLFSTTNRTSTRSAIIRWSNTEAQYYLIFREKAPFSSTDGLEPYLNISATLFQDNYTEIGIYHYRIIAHKNGINSSLSNMINISVEDLPGIAQIGFEYPRIFDAGVYEPNLSPVPYMNYTEPNIRKNTINWSTVENADYYILYKHIAPIKLSNIQEAQIIANTTSLTFTDFEVYNGVTLFYAVRAYNSSGLGGLSQVINITHLFAPDTLNITAQKSTNRTIILSWDPVTIAPSAVLLLYNTTTIDETRKFNLLNGSNDINVYIPLNSTNITIEARIGTYYYALVGINEFGFSNLSNVVVVTQDPVPYQPILSNLPEKQYNKTISLNWTAQPMAQYYVYRSTAPIVESEYLEPYAITSNNYYIDTVETSGIYYYSVIAFNATGNSSMSNVVRTEVVNRPITPSLNEISNAVNALNISWIDPFDYNNYSIKISIYPDFWNTNASLWIHNITTKEFQFSANFTATFYVWVISYNASGPSLNGTYKSATLYYIPSPRLWFVGFGIFVDHEIEFFIDPLEHVQQFEVFRGTQPISNISGLTPWKIIDYTTTFKENITDLGPYYYIFVPKNQYGKGPQSNMIQIDRNDRPKTPRILNATVDEYNSVTVTWESLDPAWISGYRVFYSRNPITNTTNPSTLISSGNLDRTRTEFKFIHIGYGKFYFVVCSFNASSLSYYSAVIELDIENKIPERTPMPFWLLYLVGGITMAGVITYALVMRSRRKTERMLESLQ